VVNEQKSHSGVAAHPLWLFVIRMAFDWLEGYSSLLSRQVQAYLRPLKRGRPSCRFDNL
jgi:hypothetical protein